MTFKPLTEDEKAAIWWGVSGQELATLIAAPESCIERLRFAQASGGDIFGGYQTTRTHLVYTWHSVVAYRTSGTECTATCMTGVDSRWPRLAICNPDDKTAGHHDRWERVGTHRTAAIALKRLAEWAAGLPADVVAPIKAMTYEQRAHIAVDDDHWLRVQLLGPHEYPVSPVARRRRLTTSRTAEPPTVPSPAGDQYLLFGGAA